MSDTASNDRGSRHCVWCGAPHRFIGSYDKLCRSCAEKRKKDSKDAGFCRGGCNRKVLWHFLRCTDCQNANRTTLEPPKQEGKKSRTPRGKALKEATAYYKEKGLPIPWEDKPTGGTWG